MKTILLLILGFVSGFAGRGAVDTLEIPWWGAALVYVPLFLTTLLVSRHLDKKAREPFDVELKAYLKANDFTLATREVVERLLPGLRVSPHAPPRTAVFVDQDVMNRIMSSFDPFLFRSRTSPFLATCKHEWPLQVSPPGGRVEASWTHEKSHKCVRGVMMHGPKCTCRCGATAAYVEQPDGTIDKTFEEPKGDGS